MTKGATGNLTAPMPPMPPTMLPIMPGGDAADAFQAIYRELGLS
jgi:hypothetical protein